MILYAHDFCHYLVHPKNIGDHICFRSNDGRIKYGVITAVDPKRTHLFSYKLLAVFNKSRK